MASQTQVVPQSSTTTTSEIELQPMAGSSSDQASLTNDNKDPVEFLPQPSTTVGMVERWNNPKVNIPRTFATFFAFVIMGANDAAYGPLIPYIEDYYNLSYVVVSLIFFSPLFGYAAAAFLNNLIHVRLGQRGVAFLGPLCHLVAYLGIALHPPYPVLVFIFIIAGFGNGLEDAAWNAWLGQMANSNEILGFLHGFYGIGAVLSPVAATTLITKAGWPWYAFYYIMLGGAAIELVTSLWAFWPISGQVYRESNPRMNATKDSRLAEALKSRVTWVVAVFLLCYVGVEVALGGWIVTFMRRERSGQPFESGMVATGFWTGIASGRFVLGFLTPRLGEKFAVATYLFLSMTCQLIFWLVPQFHVSAVAVSLQGFFLGPLFPAAVVAATKALPPYLHVSAIGFAAAFGGGGAAILPFAIGALAQATGVAVLQPVILAILVVLLLLWSCLPAINKAPDGSPNGSSLNEGQWINIDFDLVATGRRTIQKARGTRPPPAVGNDRGVRERNSKRPKREVRAEQKYIKKQILQLHAERNTPVFAVLEGVDPATSEPPPYGNVRVMHGPGTPRR